MYDRVLIPVDGSEVSSYAAMEGIRLAGILGSSVIFMYVIDMAILTIPDAETGIANADAIRGSLKAQGESVLDMLLAEAGKSGVRASVKLREGKVQEEIIAEADEAKAGLIVMGTHGRRGLNRLILGSVAESVTRSASCAVLLIRPDAE